MESSDKTIHKEQVEYSVVISLKSSSEREQVTKKLLENILNKYSLDKWILSREIIIEEGVIPHSHPTITLNTRNEVEGGLLAQFLHEQIHWIEEGKEKQMNAAIEELKMLYPKVPAGKPEGADNEKSTYRHLIVCRLEFLALNELLGEEKAKEIVSSNKGYTWIRRTVIQDGSNIDPIVKKYFPEAFK